MAQPLLDGSAIVTCAHGGRVVLLAANARVRAGGTPLVTLGDTFPVTGCSLVPPRQCARVQWTPSTVRVLVHALPALTQGSTSMVFAADGSPNGPAIVVSAQQRATAG